MPERPRPSLVAAFSSLSIIPTTPSVLLILEPVVVNQTNRTAADTNYFGRFRVIHINNEVEAAEAAEAAGAAEAPEAPEAPEASEAAEAGELLFAKSSFPTWVNIDSAPELCYAQYDTILYDTMRYDTEGL